METTVKKRVKKVCAAEAVIQRMIKEGRPLSPFAKYWLSMDYNEGKILDMRAVLR
ncbi:hypothetical protein [Candidatus Symbiothrix dinenymphae]|uniref:hypothetical protein n=1 Tax=Candidatus Symbiothrix dinenymphae TaxID=467085 RepID=UPI000A903926|nr:hypothetical protein [Candidatus Symbiothrix dinenymphae]